MPETKSRDAPRSRAFPIRIAAILIAVALVGFAAFMLTSPSQRPRGALIGGAFALAGDFEHAMLHINHALTLDGACAWAPNRFGLLKVHRGNYSDAAEAFRIAKSRPLNPINFMYSACFGSAHVDAGRCKEAARGSLTR